jgi:hypothetical protein
VDLAVVLTADAAVVFKEVAEEAVVTVFDAAELVVSEGKTSDKVAEPVVVVKVVTVGTIIRVVVALVTVTDLVV